MRGAGAQRRVAPRRGDAALRDRVPAAAGPARTGPRWALNAFVDRLWNKGLPELNQARATLGLAPLARLLEQYERPERILALTGAAFDFPAALPANVRYVDLS